VSAHGRKPLISGDDWRLWEEVRRSVAPLRAAQATAPPTAEPLPRPVAEALAKPVRHPVLPPYVPPVSRPRVDMPARLDDATLKRLKKGALEIDARIDLHGMTETAAHGALLRFLDHSRRRGDRIVLVITGKGSIGGGVLRASVPRWLHEPVFSALIGGWRVAHRSHGGEGALYLRLRRAQKGASPRRQEP